MTREPAGVASGNVTATSDPPSTCTFEATSRRSRPFMTVTLTFSASTDEPSGRSIANADSDSSSAVCPCHVTRVGVAPMTFSSASSLGWAVHRSTSIA